MKLYIPTCSLNLNNIMSSDSISPAGLYQHRKYGNKRYFPVEACPNDDAVFMYTKIPVYKVSGRDMENYRVVIEIDSMGIESQLQKIDSSHGVDVYVSESTVYFDPANTVIMFEGKDAYEASRLQAEQSLENKSFAFYQSRAIDRDMEFKWSNSYCKKYRPSHSVHSLDEDYRLDRIKGAIVCYYAGLMQVKSPELAILKKDARRIKNVFSAIANSSSRDLSPEQEKSLEPVVQEFAEVFSHVDPVSLHNREAIDRHLSSSKTLMGNADLVSRELLLKIINELYLTPSLMHLLKLSEPYNVLSIYGILGSKNMSELLPVKFAEMDRALAGVEGSLSRTSLNHICLFDTFHVADGHELKITENGPSLEFYNQFINALINGRHLENKDMKTSLAIAVLGGQTLKTLMGEEKWNASATREYINSLLNNIQNGTQFDLLSDSHEILQALAAFSLKGGEIDKLSDYLAQNGVSEYRYAWGMYGAAYGYSGLPKTFTNRILTKECISEINGILFSTANCSDKPVMNDKPEEFSFGKALGETSSERVPSCVIQDQPQNAELLSPIAERSDNKVIEEGDKDFRSQMIAFRYGKKSKSLSDKTIDQIIDIYVSSRKCVDEAFIVKVSKVRGIGDEAIKALRVYLGIPLEVKQEENTLFEDELLFVTDKGLEGIVKGLRIGDSKVEKTILEDIKYIQKTHLKDRPQDNAECINHLRNLLFMPNGKHLKETAVNKQIVEQLIDELKIRYR